MTFKVQFIIFVISSLNLAHMDIQRIQKACGHVSPLRDQGEGLGFKPLTLNRAVIG